MTVINKREFLTNEFTPLLKKLSPDTAPNFGLMTSQHMVEHLIGALQSTIVKFEGERENPANEKQLGMQQFIRSGSVITHKPSDKTAADLPALKNASLDAAIALVPKAVQDLYIFKITTLTINLMPFIWVRCYMKMLSYFISCISNIIFGSLDYLKSTHENKTVGDFKFPIANHLQAIPEYRPPAPKLR